MLHAVNRKKARLDAFRGAGLKVPLEDMVTSTIFGPLLFLDQQEATDALRLLLSALELTPPAWTGPAHLSLWPKHKTIEHLRSNYVEPDAEIVDSSGNALVIEVKWGAPLSEYELASQWLALDEKARATSQHLLIVLERHSSYQTAIKADRNQIRQHCDVNWPIRMVTWRRMADAFHAIGADMRLNAGTRRWALGVHGFLRREDPRALGGWNELGLAEVPESDWLYARRLINTPATLPQITWKYNEGWFSTADTVVLNPWSYKE